LNLVQKLEPKINKSSKEQIALIINAKVVALKAENAAKAILKSGHTDRAAISRAISAMEESNKTIASLKC
jgi:hypothetical protein